MAPPFKTATVDIMYGEGISKEGEIIDIASDLAIIDKSGAWYSYNGEKIGQGKENTKLTLEKNPELMAEIENKIKESTSTKPDVELPITEEKEESVDE